MTDPWERYLVDELGLQPKPQVRPGLHRAVDAFLGVHLQQHKPIQEQAIAPVYDGHDVLLISPTASGKTEAALIPIAARLLSDSGNSLAVYVAPTRALLNDLHRRLNGPLHRLGLESRIRHGDYPLPSKTASIRVLFTTPESLDVLLSQGHEVLSRARYAILDEIHQLFGTPRGSQLLFCLQRLQHKTRRRIQIVALSATVGNPSEVASWLRPGNQEAQIITVPGGRRIHANFRWLADQASLADSLHQSGADKSLYFVNSRRKCDDVYLALAGVGPYECFVHYSTLSKTQREYVENGFKRADRAVCVATTTLELGVDIGSIEVVVLVEPPTSISSFLQRIGRGGRRADYTEITLMPETPLQLLQFVATLSLAERGEIETVTSGLQYSVLLQQLFSIIAGKTRLNLHPDELLEQFAGFDWLSAEDMKLILDRLVDDGYLRRQLGSNVHEVGHRLETLIDKAAIFSNISGSSGGVPVFHGGRLLAYLPLRLDQTGKGSVILYAGRFWSVISASERRVVVQLASPVANPIRPLWSSKGSFSTSAILAKAMQAILIDPPDSGKHDFDSRSSHQLGQLCALVDRAEGDIDNVWHEQKRDIHVYYTFAGALENHILRLMFEEQGCSCRPAHRAEGLGFISNERLDFNRLPRDKEEIALFIERHWRQLESWAACGTFYANLPATLRKREITSLVTTSTIVASVARFGGICVSDVPLGLVR